MVGLWEIDVNKNNPIIKIQNLQQKYLIVDSLLIVPRNTYNVRFQEFSKLTKDKQIIAFNDQINLISLAKKEEQITVLPQSYSPYWDVCGSPTFTVDFYALGTTCNNKSPIKPYFRPANLFYAALALSGIFMYFFLFLCYTCLFIKVNNDKAYQINVL